MTYQLWIEGFSPSNSGTVRWYLQINRNGVNFQTDAASKNNTWMEPFKLIMGRYELKALFLTQRQYNFLKPFLRKLLSRLSSTVLASPSPTNEDNKSSKKKKPLTASQKETLHLRMMGKSYKEIEDLTGRPLETVRKEMYRLFAEWGVNNTAELIQVLLVEGEL